MHAFDHRQALGELRRVLKPGGTLALFEYSVPSRSQMTTEQREAFDFVVERSAMRSLPAFVHGAFPAILDQAGFEAVVVEDVTERIWPMLRRLARICALPAAGRPAAGGPGGPAQLHGPGRGIPAPGGLALQRRARPAAPVAASPGDAG